MNIDQICEFVLTIDEPTQAQVNEAIERLYASEQSRIDALIVIKALDVITRQAGALLDSLRN